MLSIFLATLMGLYVKQVEDEHHAHVEHEKHANPDHEVGTPNYSWLNKRTKPYPWGNNSLFFNPEARFWPLALCASLSLRVYLNYLCRLTGTTVDLQKKSKYIPRRAE